MKRPKISDFTPDYTKNKGALYVQYTIAQDEYIDYLESKINLSLGNVIKSVCKHEDKHIESIMGEGVLCNKCNTVIKN